MNNIKSFLKNNYVFLIVLVIQVTFISIAFGKYKLGYHSDELFAYGFANSYDSKDVYMDDNGNSYSMNWRDSSELLEYVSVDKDHRFNFVVPYKHAMMDLNPPLHQILLHFVCSFFPGVFSKWFGFLINIISFIIIQTFMYLLVSDMTKKNLVGVAAIVLYGFGAGCLDTVSFLRMYALGTAFAVAFMYFSYKFILNEDKKLSIHYLGACFLNLFLGAFTLHLYLVYAFPVVVVFCIALLLKKKFKGFWLHGFTQLFAVLASFLAFPKLLQNTAGNLDAYCYSAQKYSDAFQFRIYSYIITHDLFGIHFNMYSNPGIKITIAIIIFILICISPFAFMSRKEEWFKKIIRSIKDYFVRIFKNSKNSYFVIFASIATVALTILIDTKRTSVFGMTVYYSSRYLFLVYPALVIFVVTVVYYLIREIIKKKNVAETIIVILCSFFALLSQLLSFHSFLPNASGVGFDMDEIEDNANCILVVNSDWQLVNFCDDLYHTKSIYQANTRDFEGDDDLLSDISKDEPLYLLVDVTTLQTEDDAELLKDEDCDPMLIATKRDAMKESVVLDYYKSFPEIDSLEYLGEDYNFTGTIKIYKVIRAD